MCDEEQIASKLKRNRSEELEANLRRDLETFFAHKDATSSCHFHLLTLQGNEMARVDFTVSRNGAPPRRYVGNAGYVDGALSLGGVIRLL